MGWLSGYCYRQSIPVANPTSEGNRAIDAIPFAAWFLKNAQGKISGASYQDVHVTKADGTTELPCELNTDKNELYVDYATMPVGRTTLYVYYGKSGASAPTAVSYYTAKRGTEGIVTTCYADDSSLIDVGFESGTAGCTLSSGAWCTVGSPCYKRYDSACYKVGSKSGKFRGPAAAAYGGAYPTTNMAMTSNCSELRFWVMLDSNNQFRSVDIYDTVGTSGAYVSYLQFSNGGKLYVRQDTGAAIGCYRHATYEEVGCYAANTWYEFRHVFNFTANTYTLSRRTTAGCSWTYLKKATAADYNIPMRYASRAGIRNPLFRAYQTANMWVDDIRYEAGGFTCSVANTVVCSMVQNLGANGEVTAENDTAPVYYVWGDDVDSVYIADGVGADAYYGAGCSVKTGLSGAGTSPTLYLTNTAATRFGGTKLCLEQSDVSAQTYSCSAGSDGVAVNIYTNTSDGCTTLRAAGEWLASGNRAKSDIAVDITTTCVAVPSGGGITIAIDVYGGTLKYFYSPVLTSQYLKAGTFTVTVPIEVTGWSGSTGTIKAYYGGGASTVEAGLHTTPASNYHSLVKFFEGALPKGTVSDAALYLYANPVLDNTACFRAYPLKDYGDTTSIFWSAVRTGWSNDATGYPTWNKRMYDYQGSAARCWMTAGATNSNEIDTSVYTSLALSCACTTGWKHFHIGCSVIEGWLCDEYSQGVLIKRADSCTNTGYLCFAAPSQVNTPVFMVSYSALDSGQLVARKFTSDTSWQPTFPTASSYASSDMTNGFFVQGVTNSRLKLDLAYISPEGRIRRVAKNVAPTNSRFHNNTAPWGFEFDGCSGRYVTMGGRCYDARLCLFYSEPYDVSTWTYKLHSTINTAKSSFIVKDGIVHSAVLDLADDDLHYVTYDIAGGCWSTKCKLYESTVDCQRTLQTAICSTGAVSTIVASGTVSTYPSHGQVKIGSEIFWYTSRSGCTFSGITRDFFSGTQGGHAVGCLIDADEAEPTYTDMVYDSHRNAIHVQAAIGVGGKNIDKTFDEMAILYLRHYLDDADSCWYDENDNQLTAPVSTGDIPILSQSCHAAFPYAISVSCVGDIVATYMSWVGAIGSETLNYWVVSQPHGCTGWTYTDVGKTENCPISLPGSNFALVYNTVGRYYVQYSSDAGVTWGACTALSAHSFPQRTVTHGGASLNSEILNTGIIYQPHATYFGALYLDSIGLPSIVSMLLGISAVSSVYTSTRAGTSVYVPLHTSSGAGGLNCDITVTSAATIPVALSPISVTSGILITVEARAPPICYLPASSVASGFPYDITASLPSVVCTVSAVLRQPPIDRLLADIYDPTITTTPITAYLHHAILFDPSFFDPALFDTVARLQSEIIATVQPSVVPSYLSVAQSSGYPVNISGEAIVVTANLGAATATSLSTYAVQASPPTITNLYADGWNACYNKINLEWTAPDCYSGYYVQPVVNGVLGIERWAIQTATTWNTLVPVATNPFCYYYRIRTAHVYSTKYVSSPYAYSCTLIHSGETISARLGVSTSSGFAVSTNANIGASVSALSHTSTGSGHSYQVVAVSPPTITDAYLFGVAGSYLARVNWTHPSVGCVWMYNTQVIVDGGASSGLIHGELYPSTSRQDTAYLGHCYQYRVRSQIRYGSPQQSLYSNYVYSSVFSTVCTSGYEKVTVFLGCSQTTTLCSTVSFGTSVVAIQKDTASSAHKIEVPTPVSARLGVATSHHLLSDASCYPHSQYVTVVEGVAAQATEPPLVGVYATAWAKFYAPSVLVGGNSCYFQGCWTKFDTPRTGQMRCAQSSNDVTYADYFVATLPEARLGVHAWILPNGSMDGKTITGRFKTAFGWLEQTATANMYPRAELTYASGLTDTGSRCWGIVAQGCTELKLFTESDTGTVVIENTSCARKHISDSRFLSIELGADVLSVSGSTGIKIHGGGSGTDISADGENAFSKIGWASIEYVTSFNNVLTKINSIERTPNAVRFYTNADAGSRIQVWLHSITLQHMLYLVNPKRWSRDAKRGRCWKKDTTTTTTWKRDNRAVTAWDKEDEHDLAP